MKRFDNSREIHSLNFFANGKINFIMEKPVCNVIKVKNINNINNDINHNCVPLDRIHLKE